MSEPPAPAEPYSQAFEKFVQGPDDIVGLIAYALFKSSVRERRRIGETVSPASRNPTSIEIQTYRGQAERALEEYGATLIEDATPQIVSDAQSHAKDEIIEEVRRRTAGGWAILYGIVAWLLSLAITVVVVLAAPNWVRVLVEHTGGK